MHKIAKKLFVFLCAIMIVNPIFAHKEKEESCKDKCKETALTCYVLPLMIPVARKNGKCKVIGELIDNEVGMLIAAGIGHLAIIGGVTAGVVAAVKYYKKKKQAMHENEQLTEEIESAPENPLIQNQNVQIGTEEVA